MLLLLARRRLLQFGAGILAAGVGTTRAAADYPTRPVRIIEGFGGGGTPDLISRLIGQWLSERLNVPVVVENRTGAGGNIATAAVVAAPPDGYTLLAVTTANAINASLYDKLDFNFIHDIAPVAGMIRFPMVLLVNPSLPCTTLPEFIAYAKASPGKVNIASPGIGTPMHVAIELLKMMAELDLVHVPYRGPAAAFTDLLAGRVQAFIITLSTALGFIRSGKVRPLAVTGPKRSETLPELPSVGEVLHGFEATAWNGTGAPRDTPLPVIRLLSTTIQAGLADPQIRTRIKDLGGEIVPMSAPEFGEFIAAETEKWAQVVVFSGARPN